MAGQTGIDVARLLTWALGVVVFFNDYVNSVIVGNASRELTAKHKVSREKLAWVMDATSAPMATLESLQGSSTVALVTTSALIAPMLDSLGLGSELGRTLPSWRSGPVP